MVTFTGESWVEWSQWPVLVPVRDSGQRNKWHDRKVFLYPLRLPVAYFDAANISGSFKLWSWRCGSIVSKSPTSPINVNSQSCLRLTRRTGASGASPVSSARTPPSTAVWCSALTIVSTATSPASASTDSASTESRWACRSACRSAGPPTGGITYFSY